VPEKEKEFEERRTENGIGADDGEKGRRGDEVWGAARA